MTLGEKLRTTLKSEINAKLEEERKAREAEARRIAVKRVGREVLISRIKDVFIDKITQGEKPLYKITSTEQRSWINSCMGARQLEDLDLWDTFTAWLKSEDLLVKVTNDHDGFGNLDWIIVHAIPVPSPEIEAD
jgi:hypothetical protein